MNFSASKDYQGDGRYFHHSVIVQNLDKLALQPKDVMIDIGCGSGEETKAIARKVNSVTAVDSSEEMLAVARASNQAPNVSYSWRDARTLGDNAHLLDRFDKAVSFFVLHWFPEHAKALRSILACLKHGGEGLFLVANRVQFIQDAIAFLKGHARWGDYVKGYDCAYYPWNLSVAETEELFVKCGWINVKSEIQHYSPESEVRTKLLLKTVLGSSGLIPESDQEAYLEDLWQWTLAQYPDEKKKGYAFPPIELMATHASKPQSSL